MNIYHLQIYLNNLKSTYTASKVSGIRISEIVNVCDGVQTLLNVFADFDPLALVEVVDTPHDVGQHFEAAVAGQFLESRSSHHLEKILQRELVHDRGHLGSHLGLSLIHEVLLERVKHLGNCGDHGGEALDEIA